MSLATRLLNANPGAQVTTALTGSLTTPGAKGAFNLGSFYHLQTATVTSPVATLSFNSIPQTYTHLRIIATAKANYSNSGYGASAYKFQMGGGGSVVTSNLYSYGEYRGTAAGSVSYSWNGYLSYMFGLAPWNGAAGMGGYLFATTIYDILDYTNSSTIKTIREYQGWSYNASTGNSYVAYNYGTLNSATAIDTILLDSTVGGSGIADAVFAQDTKIDLYGIK